jgi:hypothetical protein
VAYFTLRGHDRRNRDIDQYVKAVVYESEMQAERMGTSDYRVTVLIDRRHIGLGNQDLELFKRFFQVKRRQGVQGQEAGGEGGMLCVGGSCINGEVRQAVGLPVVTAWQMFAELYPMKLYQVIVYPSATVTKVVWALLKPFLHPHVQRKVQLVSNLKDVHRLISPDQLLDSVSADVSKANAEAES